MQFIYYQLCIFKTMKMTYKSLKTKQEIDVIINNFIAVFYQNLILIIVYKHCKHYFHIIQSKVQTYI